MGLILLCGLILIQPLPPSSSHNICSNTEDLHTEFSVLTNVDEVFKLLRKCIGSEQFVHFCIFADAQQNRSCDKSKNLIATE